MSIHRNFHYTIKRVHVAAVVFALVLFLVGALHSHQIISRFFLYSFQNSNEAKKEEVVRNFSHLLSFGEMLDTLESGYVVCHAPAHSLGKALYSATNNIGESLSVCKNRCGGGCFHGVLIKMFSPNGPLTGPLAETPDFSMSFEQIAQDALALCKSNQVRDTVTPWRCIHGVGHVLMFASSNDIQKALTGCTSLPVSLQPSCRSGAFMEFMLPKSFERTAKATAMAPCDRYPEWSCFFNRANSMVKEHGYKSGVASCQGLPKSEQKLACIRGLGASLFYFRPNMVKQDGDVEKACGLADRDEEAACEDGVISRLVTVIDDTEDGSCDIVAERYKQLCTDKLHKIRSFTF